MVFSSTVLENNERASDGNTIFKYQNWFEMVESVLSHQSPRSVSYRFGDDVFQILDNSSSATFDLCY